MFEFAWLWVLLALPLPLVFWFLPRINSGKPAALRVPVVNDLGEVKIEQKRSSIAKLLMLSLIWLLLVIAAARPQWLGEPVNIPYEGRDLMLAVDLSSSMKVEDMIVNRQSVNRLAMIKHVLADFIQRRVGDRLGLILFADTAYLQTPLTHDRTTVEKMLNEAVIGLVGEQTAIGDAIGLAIKRFELKEDSNRILILLTDGQNTAGNITPLQAAELAQSRNVTVYTIGVGADEMLVQGFFGSRSVNPSSELDEKTLSQIAEMTGGLYFRARDTESLEDIYLTLDQLEPVQRDAQQMRPLTALFYWPLAAALILSALWALLPVLRVFFRKLQFRVNKHEVSNAS